MTNWLAMLDPHRMAHRWLGRGLIHHAAELFELDSRIDPP